MDARRRVKKTCPSSCPAGKTRLSATCTPPRLFAASLKNIHTVRTGIEYMTWLADFYARTAKKSPLGMFQIGGGIAGDFPICVVPMLHQDLQTHRRAALGLFLPDQRLDDELRQLFRRGAERKNHLGQARRGYAPVHHRIRRHHRRAADFCVRAGVVGRKGTVPANFLNKRL